MSLREPTNQLIKFLLLFLPDETLHYCDSLIIYSGTVSLSSSLQLHPDTLMELKLQLERELKSIMIKYSHYIRHIRLCVKEKGVSVEDLCTDLLSMPATSIPEQELSLLSGQRAELEKAVSINGIFNILITKYASFLDYDIFQFIVDTYQIDSGQEELKYSENLEAYLEKHKVSEFVAINPSLKKYIDSTELTIKVDVDLTFRMAGIKNLKIVIAKILKIKPAALRLLDIKDGCILVTLLIPVPVADSIFNKHTFLSRQQTKKFEELPVLWLECNGCRFDFGAKALEINYETGLGAPLPNYQYHSTTYETAQATKL